MINNVNMTIEMIDTLQRYVTEGRITKDEAEEQIKSHILSPKQADGSRPINKNIDNGESGYMKDFNKPAEAALVKKVAAGDACVDGRKLILCCLLVTNGKRAARLDQAI
ncbi:hypothetical protein J31TS6_17890 [Brevibacillus reuszeri]|nr:hypothetical protein J31TS6_17890 [Brevibacillus reuszeri]